MALFKTLPTPTDDLLPSLMVEVCLVLASDVNFFLNPRKQGLPCWRSLSFCLSSLHVLSLWFQPAIRQGQRCMQLLLAALTLDGDWTGLDWTRRCHACCPPPG